jgi:hypothetical protein
MIARNERSTLGDHQSGGGTGRSRRHRDRAWRPIRLPAQVSVRHSGRADAWISFIGAPGEKPALDAQMVQRPLGALLNNGAFQIEGDFIHSGRQLDRIGYSELFVRDGRSWLEVAREKEIQISANLINGDNTLGSPNESGGNPPDQVNIYAVDVPSGRRNC